MVRRARQTVVEFTSINFMQYRLKMKLRAVPSDSQPCAVVVAARNENPAMMEKKSPFFE